MRDPEPQLSQDTQEDIFLMEHKRLDVDESIDSRLVPTSPKTAPESILEPKPTLNQQTNLITLLNDIPEISQKFTLTGDNEFTAYLWKEVLPDLSMKQYKFLLALIYNAKTDKLLEVLPDMGFQRNLTH